MPKYCCVFGCNSDSEIYPDLSFHEFPSDKKLSKAWEIRIRRVGFVPKKSSFVCGKHFERTDYSQPRSDTPAQFRRLRLKRTAIPSLNLRGNEVDEREPKRQSRAAQKARGEHEATVVTGDMAGEGETSIDLAEYSSMSSSVDVTMQSSTKESACNLDQNLAGVKGDLKEAMAEIKELQGKVFCYENLNNKDIQNYTTLTKVAFEELSQLLAHFKPLNYWYGFEVKSLSHSDQLLVCLMKLKLDVPLFDLAKRFGVSRTTITNIFYTYIHLLHEIIFVKLMKNVPSLAKNQSSMPESFGDFSNCRIILDCTEFPLSAPRKDLEAANLVYSNYKHNLTAKYLIGVAPNGAITFVSEGYPGSTSDKVVTQECNILSHLKVRGRSLYL